MVRFFHDAQTRAAHERLHNRHQFVVVGVMNRGKTFGEDFAVAAVRAEKQIVRRQRRALSDRRRFLPHREMRRAFVVIFNALVRALHFNRVEHGFEFTNQQHVNIHLF